MLTTEQQQIYRTVTERAQGKCEKKQNKNKNKITDHKANSNFTS